MTVAMKRTAELLPLIMPYAKACPDFVAEQAARFAAIDLAERSRAWRHLVTVDLTDEPLESILQGVMEGEVFDLLFTVNGAEFQATTGAYPSGGQFTGLAVAAIHEFEFAEFNGQRLTPIQFTSMNATTEGQPRYITQVSPGTIALLPWSTGTLSMSMFLKPVSASEFGTYSADPLFDRYNVVPDHFVTMHGTTLAAGALSRILSIPDEPWTDEKKAMLYRAEFESKLNTSFRGNMRGQQRAPIRTPYRDF